MPLLHKIYAIWEIFQFYANWELCHLRRTCASSDIDFSAFQYVEVAIILTRGT